MWHIPTLLLLMASITSATPPPSPCAARMNAFCNSDAAGCVSSIKAAGGALPLFALHDAGAGSAEKQWRCYSPTCLDASNTSYVPGKACKLYCTHQDELGALLSNCTTTQLFKNGDNATHAFRIPNVIRLGRNTTTLLAFAEARRNSFSDHGPKALAMRRSTDGGSTWEPTRFLVEDPPSVADGLNLGASVFDEGSGAVFVHYGVCGHTCMPNGSTFVLSSTDMGTTWAKREITDMVTAAGWGMINAGPGTGVQLRGSGRGGGGRLAVAVWGRRLSTPGEPEGGVAALLSDDAGTTWRLSAPVLATAAHAPNECQLATLTNGSLLMNVRDARINGCRCRLMSRSDDGGETWGALREESGLTGPVCQGP